MIPLPSFDTYHTYKRAMIREVLRVLSLFCNFFNEVTTFGPVFTRLKDTNECDCNVQGIKTTISTNFQSKLIKNSKFSKQGLCLLARLLWPISHSVMELGWLSFLAINRFLAQCERNTQQTIHLKPSSHVKSVTD